MTTIFFISGADRDKTGAASRIVRIECLTLYVRPKEKIEPVTGYHLRTAVTHMREIGMTFVCTIGLRIVETTATFFTNSHDLPH